MQRTIERGKAMHPQRRLVMCLEAEARTDDDGKVGHVRLCLGSKQCKQVAGKRTFIRLGCRDCIHTNQRKVS